MDRTIKQLFTTAGIIAMAIGAFAYKYWSERKASGVDGSLTSYLAPRRRRASLDAFDARNVAASAPAYDGYMDDALDTGD